jgi:AcrR family transcriptional regulator
MTMAQRDTYTPETLLAVAVEVFIERGYDGTSMEHLSRAAGISKSSIYHHVRGKEELLRRAAGGRSTACSASWRSPAPRAGGRSSGWNTSRGAPPRC